MTAEPYEIAAVDLGSNSFHMVVARVAGEDLQILDRARERVQLAAGLDRDHRLTDASQVPALECLERFGQRLRDLPPDCVRAVGTNTLRVARNARAFLRRAEKALGHFVEIVSGTEEARLIYLGVAHNVPADPGTRLVVDIGGGSTECILGSGFEPILANSLYMGCVSYSLQYFPDGQVTADRMRRAEIAAGLEIQSVAARFRSHGWEDSVGASGTIDAIDAILRANGWDDEGITRAGLRRLRKSLVQAGEADPGRLPGLRAERAPVLPGGLAILSAVAETLEIERMTVSAGALREGLLYDMLGRIRHEDVRDRTIRNLVERHQVDAAHAARVEETALTLLRAVADPWKLDRPQLAHFLSWASRLHEIGLRVSYTGYHKHGAYLVLHSDMPGFSSDEQQLLAALIREHRRKFTGSAIEQLAIIEEPNATRLAVLLRIAVLLNRSRSAALIPPFQTDVGGDKLKVRFPHGWLEEHPLTKADLEEEKNWLAEVGIKLDYE